MIIKKDYHFYAAHRNELLDDKCFNIHGHTYYVAIELDFITGKNGISMHRGQQMLFSEIDCILHEIFVGLDHSMLINSADPLLNYLQMFQDEQEQDLKLNIFPFATSAENIAKYIFDRVRVHLPIIRIELRETTTSTVIYHGDEL